MLTRLIKNYLEKSYMMVVATSINDVPWAATVYFVTDDNLNIYWASIDTTNHSRQIKNNECVSAAIPVIHEKRKPVVGLQIAGRASRVVQEKHIRPIAKKYAKEYGFGEGWVEKFSLGETKHKLYKLSPNKIVLFDDINFPDSPRQELDLRNK